MSYSVFKLLGLFVQNELFRLFVCSPFLKIWLLHGASVTEVSVRTVEQRTSTLIEVHILRYGLDGTYLIIKILHKTIIFINETNVKLRQVVGLSCDPTRLVLRSFKAIIWKKSHEIESSDLIQSSFY